MNLSMERKKAIVSLYRAGVSMDMLAAVSGVEESTIRGVINWSEGRGRNAVLVDFPIIRLESNRHAL